MHLLNEVLLVGNKLKDYDLNKRIMILAFFLFTLQRRFKKMFIFVAKWTFYHGHQLKIV